MYTRYRGYHPICYVFTFVLSIYFFWLAGQSWQKDSYNLAAGEASMKWPTTTAHVRSCGITTKTIRTKNGSYDEYRCVVLCEYSVKGKHYACGRITFGGDADHVTQDRALANSIADHFRQGKSVCVHYNPAIPGESVLLPGIDADREDLDSWRYAWYGFGALLLTLVGMWAAEDEEFGGGRFSIVSIPVVLGIMMCIAMQPTFIRHMVAPNAIVQQFR